MVVRGKRKKEAYEKWKVLMSTALIQSVVCGVLESYGALMVPIMNSMPANDNKKIVKASLIGSLASGILMGFSPISSWLSEKFGPLVVGVSGGLVIFFATLAASFSDSFSGMALTYGVFLGIGCSLLFMSNSIIISQHFGENSTVAFGLLGFGNGVMDSVMPHILTYAVNSIKLSGAIRTVCLMFCPIMFLPFYWKEINFEVDKPLNMTIVETNYDELKSTVVFSGDNERKQTVKNKNQGNKVSKRALKRQKKMDYNFNNKHMWESDLEEDDMIIFRPQHNVNNEIIDFKTPSFRSSVTSDFDFLSSSLSTEKVEERFQINKYFEVFKNKGFLNLCISMTISSLGYQVANVHMVNYSNDKGLSGNSQLLLTCLGAASAVGPLINPLFVDKFEEHISKFRIFQIFVLGYGISVIFVPLVNNFNILMITCCLIGYFDGSLSTIVGPLTIDLVGTEKAGNAIGIYYGSIALSVTLAAPLAGFIFEVGKQYRTSFFVAGLFFLCGGFMLSFTHKNFKFQEPSHDTSNIRLTPET